MWSLVAFSVAYGVVLVHDLIFDQVRFAILLAVEVVLTIVGVLGFAIWSSRREQRR